MGLKMCSMLVREHGEYIVWTLVNIQTSWLPWPGPDAGSYMYDRDIEVNILNRKELRRRRLKRY